MISPFRFALVTLAVVAVAPAHAATVSAIAQVDYSAVIRFNGGDTAIPGVDVTDTLSAPIPGVSSTLAAPDAVNESDQTTVIDGTSPATPSQFSRLDRTTRNGGAEGGDARTSLFTYGVRVNDAEPDTGGSLVEIGRTGTTSSQARIATDPFAADAAADLFNARTFSFRNLSAVDTAFFTITGELDVTAIAQVTGADALARSVVAFDLAFSSDDPMTISFAPLMPFLPLESATGPAAATSFGRSIDPSGAGLVGLSALASATGSDPFGLDSASVSLSDRFVLGVTLAPSQVLSMTASLSAVTVATVDPLIAPVPLPAGLPLLVAGFGLFGVLRRRRRGQRQPS